MYKVLRIFTIICILLLIFAFIIFENEEDCGCFDFKEINGVIINKDISIQWQKDNNSLDYKIYKQDIVYEYIVNEIKYIGKFNASYKTMSNEKNIVEKYLEKYYIGKTVIIEYDKHFPENSYMKNKNPKYYRNILIIISLTGIFLGTCIKILLNKYRK